MVQLVVFVNLFFVPVLSLYLLYRKKQKTLRLNLDLLLQYCIITACNIPLTKVFIFLAKRVGGVFISIDSGYYTLAALISAFLIYMLYMYQESEENQKYWIKQYTYYKTYTTEKKWSEKISQRGKKRILRELVPAYFLIFASCFMMLVFEPILMYATNMNDFWFDFKIMIWPLLGVFACFLLGGILIASIVYFLNLSFSGRMILYKGLTIAGFLVFFLLYLQGNWLAGNLPPLTGEPIIWENYGESENFIMTTAMLILIVAAIIGIRRFKLDRTIRYAAVGAGVVFVMLLVSLIPTVVENEAFKSKDTFSPTMENFNKVSSNKNFFVFLVDAVDSKVFRDIMTYDDEFDGVLDDFTYYPDTLSVFPRTRDSIPTILTGTVNHNETSFIDYCNNVYNQSIFFEKLEQNGYGINIYSSDVAWGGHRQFQIENSASIYDIEVSLLGFMKEELKYIQFKYFPYALKKYSQIETLDFDTCKIIESGQDGYVCWNQTVYANIIENKLLEKTEDCYFHFIHCEGAHAPFNMDKSLNIIENGTYEQKVAASFTMIKTYLQRLKDNNVYDNSVIVIMADHGYQSDAYPYPENPLSVLDRCNPILFIKGMGEKHELRKSNCPVLYLDLQDAFCDLIDGKQSNELFTNLKSGRTRTVIWDIWTQENHMVEYETTGKAWELEKFTPTGNVYDLEE